MLLADDESDDDVLDPAQLAFASTDTQPAVQQHQQHQQQQDRSQAHTIQAMQQQQELHQEPVKDPNDMPRANQPHAPFSHEHQAQQALSASLRPVEHGHLCFDDADVSDAQEEEEELICMDDPRFASLSERRQKLMALEEVLLNTGIDG